MNSELLAVLSEIREHAELTGEVYKEKAYRRAIESIKRLRYHIDADHLPDLRERKIAGVGKGILEKITEFARSGRIAEWEQVKQSREYLAWKTFSQIMGVGPETIKKWLAMRVYDFASLRRAVASGKIALNDMQKLGIRYYQDLISRIPREETTQLGGYVIGLMRKIDAVTAVIAGSYRRGKPTQGDIDIIVMSPHGYDSKFLDQLHAVVEAEPSYVATLSKGSEKFTFLIKSPTSGLVRHIDVWYLQRDNYFTFVNYATGSDNHNTYMRGILRKKGYRLNQNGLFKVNGKNLVRVPVNSEEDIYKVAGVTYIQPEQRD